MGIHYLQLGEPNRHVLWIENGANGTSRVLYSYGIPRAVLDTSVGRITRYKSDDYEARSTTRHIASFLGSGSVYVLPQEFFQDARILHETPWERMTRAEALCSRLGYTLASRLRAGPNPDPDPDPDGSADCTLYNSRGDRVIPVSEEPCSNPDCSYCYDIA
jgi:hypothetical protein